MSTVPPNFEGYLNQSLVPNIPAASRLPQNRLYFCDQFGHAYIYPRNEPLPTLTNPRPCNRCNGIFRPAEPRANKLSYSMMQTFGQCPRKAYYSYVLGLQRIPQHDMNPKQQNTLDAGTLVHHGLETFYRTAGSFAIRSQAAIQAILDRQAVGDLIIPIEASTDTPRSLELIINTFAKYFQHYRHDSLRIVRDSTNQPLVEIDFTILIEDSDDLHRDSDFPLLFYGIIDGIYELKGKLYNVDHKSTGNISFASKIQARVSTQHTSYIYAAQQLLQVELAGGITNIIGLFKNLEPEKHFLRIPVTRSERSIEQWRYETIRKFRRYQVSRETNTWDRETIACTMYGSVCPFLEPCFADSTEMERLSINGNYMKKSGRRDRRVSSQSQSQ